MNDEFIRARTAFEEAYKNFNECNYNLSIAITTEEKEVAKKELSTALERFNSAYKCYISVKSSDD